MAARRPSAFFDANVLVSASLSPKGAAYGLLQLVELGALSGFTSTEVVNECRRAIERVAPSASRDLGRLLGRMRLRVRPAPRSTTGLDELAEAKDLHVVATALRARVQYLVTFNLRDFKGRLLRERYGLQVVSPTMLLRTLFARPET